MWRTCWLRKFLPRYKMEVFDKPNIFIKNHAKVEKILTELHQSSPNDLQIIADFDRTMTKSENNGVKTDSTFGVLENNDLMPAAIREETLKNTSHYLPIEMDPIMPIKEKIPLMIEWYKKNFQLIVKSHYNRKDFVYMVQQSNAVLRDECDSVLKLAELHKIPVLIISAGLGDIIYEILKFQSNLYSNIKIVANFMSYDEDNYVHGMQDELIHTFNKDIAPLRDPQYFKEIEKRKNVVMLGDSQGDVDMVAHLSEDHNILKIGFLNGKVKESLPNYMEIYDVVITEDQTWNVLFTILKKILNS